MQPIQLARSHDDEANLGRWAIVIAHMDLQAIQIEPADGPIPFDVGRIPLVTEFRALHQDRQRRANPDRSKPTKSDELDEVGAQHCGAPLVRGFQDRYGGPATSRQEFHLSNMRLKSLNGNVIRPF